MKTRLVLPLALLILSACEGGLFRKEYHDLGSFSGRVEAEQRALTYLSNEYASLPKEDFYKVMYYFKKTGDTLYRHAIWYDKNNGVLAIETDVHSGTTCRWQQVDRAILAQIARAGRGIVSADSLAQPESDSCYAKFIASWY